MRQIREMKGTVRNEAPEEGEPQDELDLKLSPVDVRIGYNEAMKAKNIEAEG